jgi:hypothetical protein
VARHLVDVLVDQAMLDTLIKAGLDDPLGSPKGDSCYLGPEIGNSLLAGSFDVGGRPLTHLNNVGFRPRGQINLEMA